MQKMKAGTGLAVLILFFALTSCRPPGQQDENKTESFGAAPVKVIRVQKQAISEKLSYSGVIEAQQKINITPDIGGKIARIYVREGEKVEAGQVLAELDTRAIRLQLEQARAGLAVAEASYKDARRNMERMERLKQENAVSEQQYEKVRLASEAAEAQLKQAQATVNLADHNLEVSIMKAPFSGVVASRNAEVGDVINPMMGGFSPMSGILTLMDFSQVKAEVDVSHRDIIRIKRGQPARLRVSAFPDRDFRGTVSLVNVTADPTTKKFKVEVVVENPELLLRPNTFGEVILEVSTHEDALVIPQKAVIENRYVFLARNDNTVERREVTLGLQNADRVEVVKGLNEGDLVVVEGNFGLEDGTAVEIRGVLQ